MFKVQYILLAISIALNLPVFSQTDLCVSAETLIPGDGICNPTSGSTENLSQSLPGCSGNADDDGWFQFVANSTEMTITVNPSDNYDAVFQLYSGNCGALTSIFCKDAGGDNVNETHTATGLTIGNTYFVRVYDFGVGSGSDLFTICVWGVPPASSMDDPCTALPLDEITPSCNYGTYTTAGASSTGIPAPGTCGTVGYAGGDVWFSAVVPSNGEIEIYTFSEDFVDGAMGLYSGSCLAPSLISCNDDRTGSDFMPYIHETGLTPGDSIFIRVWEFNNDDPGKFGLCVSSPLNDDCNDASLICDLDGYGGVTSGHYTPDEPDNMCGIGDPASPNPGCVFGTGYTGPSPVQIDNNSWITFVATEPTAVLEVEVRDCINNNFVQMQVFSGDNCTNFSPVSNFIETAGTETITATGLTPGETYYIVTDGFNGDICFYSISAVSGVQVIELTSSAGTSVCNGQPVDLTAESTGNTVSYSWEANPGGPFGSGQQIESVTVTAVTEYTVTVTGFCNSAEIASITISPDKIVTADFYATTTTSTASTPAIAPFPNNMTCDDEEITLWALDSSSAGMLVSPGLKFVFTTDANTVADNTRATIYKNGSPIYNSNPLPANTILTVWSDRMSPGAAYTVELCDDANNGTVTLDVFDLNSQLKIDTDTLKTGSPCVTYGPYSPVGIASWSINPATAGFTNTGDSGVAFFNPQAAGVGVYDITYSWDNTVGCSDVETKTITVTNPHDASWNAPAPLCENEDPINLTTLIDATASSTTGTWSGSGVSGNTFDPTGLSGNISVTYTVSGVACNDAVTNTITVNAIPTANAVTVTACEYGGGNALFNLTSEDNNINGGSGDAVTWHSNLSATAPIATPSNYSAGNSTVYAVVINGSGCSDTTGVSLLVNPKPSSSNASMSECDIGVGSGNFDLTSLDNTVNTGIGANSVSWFTNAGATAAIGTPNAYLSGSNTVYAVVSDGATGCTDTVSVSLTMLPQPTANNLSPSICETVLATGIALNVDLTSNEPNINSNGGITFSWFEDAALSTPVTDPTDETVSNGDDYFVSVSDGNGCSDTAQVDYSVTGTIALNDPNITFCEDDFGLGTVANVNLTSFNGSIYTGSGSESFIWYEGSGTGSPVPDATNVTLDQGTYDTFTISVTDGNCSNNITITATINNAPATALASAELCDQGGLTASFNLNTLNSTVDVGAGNTVNWFTDANASSSIGTPNSFNTISTTVYAVVIDGNSCSDTTSASLTVNPNPLLSTTVTNATCFGFSDGTATAIETSGLTGISYVWSIGAQTTQTATGLDLGNYNVTLSTPKNCTVSGTATLSQPTQLTITNYSLTEPTCNGYSDGIIEANVQGGTTNYSFIWSNGSTNNPITNLLSSNYSLTVTDANNCTTSSNVSLSEPTSISSASVVQNASCNGSSDGSITVTASGGTGTLNYNWSSGFSNSGASSEQSNLSSGNYTISITDDNNCILIESITISEPSAISISFTNVSVSCNGGNTGSSTATPSGGTPPYVYDWSNGLKTPSITGQPAGVYTITISDNVTPTACIAIATTTISEPDLLTVSTTVTNITCGSGNSGEINSSVMGGELPYTFNWNNGETTQNLTGLAANSYQLTVTDNNNCSQIVTNTVTGSATNLAVSLTKVDISCNGNNDGQVSSVVSGGDTPYSYLWSNGATNNSIFGLSTNSYSITVQDPNGCEGTASTTINEPAALSLTFNVTPVNCNGESSGNVNVTPSGGRTAYSYLWNTSNNSNALNNIPSGSYSVTVTDGTTPFGCSVSNSITVTEPLLFTVNNTVTNVNCGSGSSGAISLSASGGTTPYNYLWSTSETNQNISGLPPGDYSFTVTDNNSCSYSENLTVTGSPIGINISISASNISCFGASNGSASTIISGGESPYTYSWSSLQTTASISNLSSNNYSLTVSDIFGCTSNSQVSISEPLQLNLSLTSIDVDCNGASSGSASVVVSGGTTPYSFLWSDVGGQNSPTATSLENGIYTISVNDLNNCSITTSTTITEPPALTISSDFINPTCFGQADGSASVTVTGGSPAYNCVWNDALGTTGPTAENLTDGDYHCQCVDNNNCLVSTTVTLNEPNLLESTASGTQSCQGTNNGGVTVSTSGGTTPYAYNWNTGTGTTANLSGLFPGIYTVTVIDDNNCISEATATVQSLVLPIANNLTITVCESPDSLNFAFPVDLTENESQINGNIGVTYNWFDSQNISITNPNLLAVADKSEFKVVVDNGTCKDSSQVVYLVNDIAFANISGGGEVCEDSSTTANIIFNFTGTTPFNFTYLFNGDSIEVVNYASHTYVITTNILGAGIYEMGTITNANGCINDQILTSSQILPTGPSADFLPDVDNGDPPLVVTFNNNSTNTGFEIFEWEFGNGFSSGDFSPTSTYNEAGSYNVILWVEDHQGCTDSMHYTITVGDESSITVPTIFTPNDDGVNDIFSPNGHNISEIKGDIFNRWGQRIFTFDKIKMGWDGRNFTGTEAPEGTYFYVITATGLDGKKYEELGSILLIR